MVDKGNMLTFRGCERRLSIPNHFDHTLRERKDWREIRAQGQPFPQSLKEAEILTEDLKAAEE